MIEIENIKKAVLDLGGGSYIRFETDLELKNESLGDFYWQGDKKFFEINADDFLNGRNEEFKEDGESIEDFLSEEAIEYLVILFRGDLAAFV